MLKEVMLMCFAYKHAHGRRKGFSQGQPKIFFQPGPKVVKLRYTGLKLRKQPFLLCKRKMSNFKIQESGKAHPCPPTFINMPSSR